jgi:hypothetical protein
VDPPFGDPLRAALEALADEELLDLGCAPADGAFAYTRQGNASGLETCTTEKALLFFAMRLFQQLQRIGTVPAIDMDRWGDVAWA